MANTEGTGAEKKTTPRKPVVVQKGSKTPIKVRAAPAPMRTGPGRSPEGGRRGASYGMGPNRPSRSRDYNPLMPGTQADARLSGLSPVTVSPQEANYMIGPGQADPWVQALLRAVEDKGTEVGSQFLRDLAEYGSSGVTSPFVIE